MYSIIAKLPTTSPTPLRGTMHLLNGTLDVVTMFSQSSVGRGHLFSPPANRNEPDQTNARWWLCIHWASAHVHVFMHNLFTPTPQASKVGNYWENESSRSILCRRGSMCCLFVAWWRAPAQQVWSSNCCRSLVKCPPPTLSFSCHHYNNETERQRW